MLGEMYILGYGAAATMFYAAIMKFAPIWEEPREFSQATPSSAEIIELFPAVDAERKVA
jgi:hypothetical protein